MSVYIYEFYWVFKCQNISQKSGCNRQINSVISSSFFLIRSKAKIKPFPLFWRSGDRGDDLLHEVLTAVTISPAAGLTCNSETPYWYQEQPTTGPLTLSTINTALVGSSGT